MSVADTNFSTGAVRSAAVAHLSFTSLPMIGLLAVARTAGEGAEKYGRFNYMLGMPVHDLLDHVFTHLARYTAGDRSEPHMEHASWGCLVAVQSAVLNPELSAPHMLGPGSVLTKPMLDYIEAMKPILAAQRKAGAFEGSGDWKTSELPEVKALLDQRKPVVASEAETKVLPNSRRDGTQRPKDEEKFYHCSECDDRETCVIEGRCVFPRLAAHRITN